ncbi:MAG: carbohydrate kinase family protein [Anaerolineae bacterium]|nr:carbohydrate kinase family protein [Anaerolineae bacterium]
MPRILVSGLINIETTLRVDDFPIHYSPVRYPFHGVNSSVSGVGYNLAKALTCLGNRVNFLSIIGQDFAAGQVRATLAADQIGDDYILSQITHTPQSVIIYDPDGRRQINVDLKDIQEQTYPAARFEQAMQRSDLLALCNINFSRPMLHAARKAGKLIASDVHTIGDLHDDYNADFMAAANILFMSNESLPMPPEDWAKALLKTYHNEIIVIGLGEKGALLAVRKDNFIGRFPAVQVRPIVNTIGAGDALFSAFIHSYLHSANPYAAIRKAILFAGYKIGAISAAEGFLGSKEFDEL